MDPKIVGALISDWTFIRDVLISSLQRVSSDKRSEKTLAILSLMSSRREYWEFLVSIASYASKVGKSPNLSFKEILAGLEDDTFETKRYLREVVSLPAEDVLRVGLATAQIIQTDPEFQPIRVLTRLGYCLIVCKDKPDYAACLEKCLRGD